MLPARIRLILDTEKPAAAEKIIKRIQADIDTTVKSSKPHAKGGIEVVLELTLMAEDWPAQALELIRTAQHLGYGWHLTGSIDEEISLTSEAFRFSGIRWACIEATCFAGGEV